MGILRFALALSVVIAHTGTSGVFGGFGGENAVEAFFLISGFYISEILTKTYKNSKDFYINRALRLYPIYFFVCILVLINSFLVKGNLSDFFSYPLNVLSLPTIANLTLIGGDIAMFLQTDGMSIAIGHFEDSHPPLYTLLLVPQSWTLSLEITFYLLAPFLVRFKTRAICLLIAVLLILRITCFYAGLNFDPWTYRFFPFELPLFLIGILLSRLKSNIFLIKIPYSLQWLIVIFAYFISGYFLHLQIFPRKITLFILLIVTCCLILNSHQPNIDKKFGDLSYPIYICHLCVFDWVYTTFEHFEKFNYLVSSVLIYTSLKVVLTVIFSVGLLKISGKIENIRDNIRNRSLS